MKNYSGLIPCKCGCRELIHEYAGRGHHRRKIIGYVMGHQALGNTINEKQINEIAWRSFYRRAHILYGHLIRQKGCFISNDQCKGRLILRPLNRDFRDLTSDNWACLCISHHALMKNRNLSIQELKDLPKDYYVDVKGKRRYYHRFRHYRWVNP